MSIKKRYFLLSIGFIPLLLSLCAIDLTQAIFSEKMSLEKGANKAATAVTLAKSFLGNDYVSHTIEQTPERLVCNLKGFDCYTFVESVLAMANTRHHAKTYLQFQMKLRQMRYREGIIDGYGSRLHYFLEWKQQGEAQGLFTDITAQLGGSKIQPTIHFMASHRALYPALEDEVAFQTIQSVEKKLSNTPWFFIPKNKVADIEDDLQEGDIIGITSGVDGLDFNHEGFVTKKARRAYLLHASSEVKKVVIAAEPLADYLQRVKKHTGIVVLRIRD